MIGRRDLLIGTACLVLSNAAAGRAGAASAPVDLAAIERTRVMRAGSAFLAHAPRTIAAIPAPRSPGTRHDYYSEGDYWWPDPANPSGPYVRRDGFSNPTKFDGHRDALIRFGVEMPALAAAWALSKDSRYAQHAVAHLKAWFVDPATRMAPSLAHAQAIIGVNSGRAIGIIDTLQIVEVARGAELLRRTGAPGYVAIRAGVEGWFRDYLAWLTTSPAGREERDQTNNHGTCWLLQAAAFASLVGDTPVIDAVRKRLIETIIPHQIAPDGSQPLELARTKPYSYSLFNLDVLAGACRLLSRDNDLWRFATADGRGIGKAIGFMAPFIRDKARWPYAKDVEYFDDLPVRQPSLLFGGEALGRADWLTLWQSLDADPTVAEVVRNFPIRQPLLWPATGLTETFAGRQFESGDSIYHGRTA
ncbi:MAG: alginate lyase family protein [Pseudomonadota bacterium]|uniref:alginate lyase family protein n=1 Tax=Sphingomonas sp. ERG5 TaxID=1381597 RepID=UPI00068BA82C|nr:alginate lyase family protein [Sphingomonas sp. ERG5]